ncbi:hypothetical protein ACYSUW_14670 [Pseudomonas frederiksbergensis]
MQEAKAVSLQPSSTLPSKEQLAILLTFQYSADTGHTVIEIANRHDTLSRGSETKDGWEIFRDAVKGNTPIGIALAQTGFFDPEVATILSVVQDVENAPKAAVEYLRVLVHSGNRFW